MTSESEVTTERTDEELDRRKRLNNQTMHLNTYSATHTKPTRQMKNHQKTDWHKICPMHNKDPSLRKGPCLGSCIGNQR